MRSRPVPMRRSDPLRRLEAVLTDEAEAIRHADFSRLDDLISDKTLLADQLLRVRPRPGADRLDRLHRLAERNAVLLQASLQGLRAAQARISALSERRTDMRTYDATGAAQTVPGAVPSLERRA